jgi:hypothetical protein
MSTIRRSSVRLRREVAIQTRRVALGDLKLVYIIVADKKLQYPNGRSRIAYIGTTKRGIARIAGSVAYRAQSVLGLHGVQSLEARILTCRPRQKVKSWLKLERALLLAFREAYGSVPKCNSHGKKISEGNEFSIFSRARVNRVIEDLA